jgi:hypothetical protein
MLNAGFTKLNLQKKQQNVVIFCTFQLIFLISSIFQIIESERLI